MQTFDTELLRSLVAVAESGGFTHAARILHSTQSTVSAQIQRLEEVAGTPLFIRSTRTVRLTSAGETLLGYARTILRLNEDARLRLSGARHAGRVRIGANEDLTHGRTSHHAVTPANHETRPPYPRPETQNAAASGD